MPVDAKDPEMDSRKKLIFEPAPGEDPEIGRWLWALEDTRRRTQEELEHVTPPMIDWHPPDEEVSIGSVLYHMAVIEADWLYVEVLEEPFPEAVTVLFPHGVRDEAGQLVVAEGESLEAHLGRLAAVRSRLLAAYRGMDPDEFRRARALPEYDVTPEWVLHHLMQHEAEHRSQIGWLRIKAGSVFSP